MSDDRSRATVEKVLGLADIRIDGDRPWDIQVHNASFYRRVLGNPVLALGESYMDGWWDAAELDEFFHKLLRSDVRQMVQRDWRLSLDLLVQRFVNRQTRSGALRATARHYDRGNDLFKAMLDRRMVYSCAYWKNATTLDEAQEAKLDLVCRKMYLQPGMRVLDIGCGWGSLCRYAAERHGVTVAGINTSKEQTELGRSMCAGLPVEIDVRDYRDVEGTYDRIVSLGMFEHVGPKNYRTYMEVVHRHLKDDGLFLLHSLGGNKKVNVHDVWAEKYIFPRWSGTPIIEQIGKAAEPYFKLEDWHSIGAYYSPTLMAWFQNFHAHWPELEPRYGAPFYKMWKYFLLCGAGAFRARDSDVWQIVFSKGGVPGGYISLR